jgi:hypothetical protein
MIDAFDALLSMERRMEGELAQSTCSDIAVLLISLRLECAKYVYENVRDISGLDPHVVIASLDLPVPNAVPADDGDLYGDLRLRGLARARTYETNSAVSAGLPSG